MIDLPQQFHEDLSTCLNQLHSTGPLDTKHIRQTSHILRKWLVEGQINRLAKSANTKLMLPAYDTSEIVNAIGKTNTISYYCSGGIQIWDQPIRHLHLSFESVPSEGFIDVLNDAPITKFTPARFLKRKVIYFEDHWFSVKDVISIYANKFGGVHIDDYSKLNNKEKSLAHAAEYLQFVPESMIGSPELEREDAFLIPIKDKLIGNNTWTCLEIEVLAIAGSLTNVCDDQGHLLEYTTTPVSHFRKMMNLLKYGSIHNPE